jgi:hypothetical protein
MLDKVVNSKHHKLRKRQIFIVGGGGGYRKVVHIKLVPRTSKKRDVKTSTSKKKIKTHFVINDQKKYRDCLSIILQSKLINKKNT